MGSVARVLYPAGMPGQFRLLVGGALLNSTGMSMVFPFLSLYLTTHLGVPVDRVGLVFLVQASGGLVAQTVAGPVADHVGRKPVMVLGLLAQSCVSLGYTQAGSFEQFVALAGIGGFCGAMFQPASQAMVVDLVGIERRAEAFGLIRVAANLGFVIGPSLGGLLATQSYTSLFVLMAALQLVYVAALTVFAGETLPARDKAVRIQGWTGGYGVIARDRSFMILVVASLLTTLVYTQLGTILPIYLKQDLGISESVYGLLMAMNGGLVVLLQLPTTKLVEHRNRAYMLSAGAVFYAIGLGSMGLGRDVWIFILGMVLVTAGEMILAPVSSAMVADLAPEQMRARYMAAYGLTWTVSFGLGPVLGGNVMARLGSQWVWAFAFLVGCLAAIAYLPLRKEGRERKEG
jgi:MFS family permease